MGKLEFTLKTYLIVVVFFEDDHGGEHGDLSEEDGHSGWGQVGFARHEGAGIFTVEASALVEEDHWLCLNHMTGGALKSSSPCDAPS